MSSATPETVALPPQYNPGGELRSTLVAVPLSKTTERVPGAPVRRRLGEVLIDQGLVTPEQLEQALQVQVADPPPRRRLGQVVASMGFATEREVAEALATSLGLSAADLSRIVPAPDVVRLLPRAVAERTGVLVLDRHPSGGLVIATSDPTNVLALDDVRMYTQAPELFVVVAPATQIKDHLTRAWSLSEDTSGVSMIAEELEETTSEDFGAGGVDDAPIVKLVNQVLADA
ncbi:MAG: hypothetical protein ABIV05_04590, partial [Actinomycetota bacterium]